MLIHDHMTPADLPLLHVRLPDRHACHRYRHGLLRQGRGECTIYDTYITMYDTYITMYDTYITMYDHMMCMMCMLLILKRPLLLVVVVGHGWTPSGS